MSRGADEAWIPWPARGQQISAADHQVLCPTTSRRDLVAPSRPSSLTGPTRVLDDHRIILIEYVPLKRLIMPTAIDGRLARRSPMQWDPADERAAAQALAVEQALKRLDLTSLRGPDRPLARGPQWAQVARHRLGEAHK